MRRGKEVIEDVDRGSEGGKVWVEVEVDSITWREAAGSEVVADLHWWRAEGLAVFREFTVNLYRISLRRRETRDHRCQFLLRLEPFMNSA